MQRILIIEDDPIYREMLSETLEEEGYEVILAENGMEGIEKANAFLPSLVISDVVMQGADGYQVLSTLKNQPSTSGIPFILMTGWSSKGGQRQGMVLGADDYLAKPFSASELLEAINTQFAKHDRTTKGAQHQSVVTSVSVSSLLPSEIERYLREIQGLSEILSQGPPGIELDDLRNLGSQISVAAGKIQRATDNYVLYHQLSSLQQDDEARSQLRMDLIPSVASFLEERILTLASYFQRESDLELRLSDGGLRMSAAYLAKLADELVTNALSYSPRGTKIIVVAAFAPERFGFSVTDHGRGIPPELLTTLEAFIQKGKKDISEPGLGLGLAICRKIAFLHGGSLRLKSTLGEKTHVVVELPN